MFPKYTFAKKITTQQQHPPKPKSKGNDSFLLWYNIFPEHNQILKRALMSPSFCYVLDLEEFVTFLRDLPSIKLSARHLETLQGNGEKEQIKLISLQRELQTPVLKAWTILSSCHLHCIELLTNTKLSKIMENRRKQMWLVTICNIVSVQQLFREELIVL